MSFYHRNPDSFGLLAWLNETRIRLPLRSVDFHFEVAGNIADVTLEQVFQNTFGQPLEVTYSFPLPAAAAIYRCEMVINGRVISAVVENEEKARLQYITALSEGHMAAMVSQQRDNLFTLKLGNVPTQSAIIVRLSYVQEVERLVDSVSIRIPTCPGERYIPGQPLLRSNLGKGTTDDTDQVPDASLLTPPRIDSLHPDAAQLSLSGRLFASEAQAASFLSPSHTLIVRETGDHIRVTIAPNAAVPDQDIVIRWTPAKLEPDTVLTTTASYRGEGAAVSRLRGPIAPGHREPRREIWFLMDRSTSMTGENWAKSCLALKEAIGQLESDDQVGISFFSSGMRHFSDRPVAVSLIREDPKFRNIEQIGTDGGTELLPALEWVARTWKKYPQVANHRHLILLTDGQVGNEPEILKTAEDFPESMKIHTLGIDRAVNDALLVKLSQQTGGTCVFVHPNDSVVEAVLALVRDIHSPAVKELQLRGSWRTVGRSPCSLSSLGETSAVLASLSPDEPVFWTGSTSHGETWRPKTHQQRAASPGVVLIRIRREIDALLASHRHAEAVELAKRFNLLCEGACFIAIDRETKGQVGAREIYQPAFEARNSDTVFYRMSASNDYDGRTSSALRAASGSFGRTRHFNLFEDLLSDIMGTNSRSNPHPGHYPKSIAFLRSQGTVLEWLSVVSSEFANPTAIEVVHRLSKLISSTERMGLLSVGSREGKNVVDRLMALIGNPIRIGERERLGLVRNQVTAFLTDGVLKPEEGEMLETGLMEILCFPLMIEVSDDDL